MTLIALTVNDVFEREGGFPILMADILFSSDVPSGNVSTPTYTQGTGHLFDVNSLSYPIWLKQKLYIINDRLCVALGGDGDQMKKFLTQLKLIYSSIDFNDDDLSKFVDEFAAEYGHELIAIIVTAKLRSDKSYHYQVKSIGIKNEEILSSKLYGRVVASGSGAKPFLDFIKDGPQFGTDITNTDAFLASNEGLIAHFLGLEVVNGSTLKRWWGAGFEMIYHENGKFVKLDKYTVVIMEATFGQNVEYEAKPRLSMMITYEDDVMLIKTISDQEKKNFTVPSIIDNATRTIEKDFLPEENALLMSYIFYHTDNNNKVYHASTVLPRNVFEYDKSPVVYEKDEQGNISISIDRKLDQWMVERMLTGNGFKFNIKRDSTT